MQLRVLVFVRIPPLKFWAGPDDVKRQDARAKSTPMLPASIRVCSPGHHAINQLGMPHHWAAPDRLAAALFVSASLRQDGQVEKGSLQLLWDVTSPKHCLPCPRTQAPTSKGLPARPGSFRCAGGVVYRRPRLWYDALVGRCTALRDVQKVWRCVQCMVGTGHSGPFDGGMVVPGRPLSQCLGKPQVGGGPRPLSLQAPSPLKVRSREDVIPLLQARVTTSGSDLFFKDFVVSTRRVEDIPIARTVDESSTAEIDSLRSFRNP